MPSPWWKATPRGFRVEAFRRHLFNGAVAEAPRAFGSVGRWWSRRGHRLSCRRRSRDLFTVSDTITKIEVFDANTPRFPVSDKIDLRFLSPATANISGRRSAGSQGAFTVSRSDCPGLSHTFGSNCPTKSVKISGDWGIRAAPMALRWLNYDSVRVPRSFFDF